MGVAFLLPALFAHWAGHILSLNDYFHAGVAICFKISFTLALQPVCRQALFPLEAVEVMWAVII